MTVLEWGHSEQTTREVEVAKEKLKRKRSTKPGVPLARLRGPQPVRRVVSFRELVGEKRYAEWLQEQTDQRQRRAKVRARLSPAAHEQADAATWWNSTGRFQSR